MLTALFIILMFAVFGKLILFAFKASGWEMMAKVRRLSISFV